MEHERSIAQDSKNVPEDDAECCSIVYLDCCPERESFVHSGQKICCIVGVLSGFVGGYFLVKTEDLFDYFTRQFDNNVIGGGVGVTILVLGLGFTGWCVGKNCLGTGIGNVCYDLTERSFNFAKKSINNIYSCYSFFFHNDETPAQDSSNSSQEIKPAIPLRTIEVLYANRNAQIKPNNLFMISEINESKVIEIEEIDDIKEDILIASDKKPKSDRLKLAWLHNSNVNQINEPVQEVEQLSKLTQNEHKERSIAI